MLWGQGGWRLSGQPHLKSLAVQGGRFSPALVCLCLSPHTTPSLSPRVPLPSLSPSLSYLLPSSTVFSGFQWQKSCHLSGLCESGMWSEPISKGLSLLTVCGPGGKPRDWGWGWRPLKGCRRTGCWGLAGLSVRTAACGLPTCSSAGFQGEQGARWKPYFMIPGKSHSIISLSSHWSKKLQWSARFKG